MIFFAAREPLTALVERASAVAGRRSSMQILSHLVLEARGESLTVRATDMETGFEGTMDLGQEATPGAVAVEAKLFLGLVKGGAGEEVVGELNSKNLRLKVMIGSATCHLPGLAADEFPSLPDPGMGAGIMTEAEDLAGPLGVVAPCMGRDSGRANIAGIHLEKLDDGRLRAVATDGHRLSQIDTELELDLERPVLIPAKGVAEILRMLKTGGKASLTMSREALALAVGSSRLTVRNGVEGFPDYRQISSVSEGQPEAMVNRPALQAALARMAILTDNNFTSVVLKLDGKLTLIMDNPDRGEIKDTLPLASNEAGEARIRLNLRYLRDMLGAMRSEEVTLSALTGRAPVRFTGPGDPGFMGHIMPVQDQED